VTKSAAMSDERPSPLARYLFVAYVFLVVYASLHPFSGWRDQGYELVSLKSLYESLDVASLPRSEVVLGEVPGRSGTLALQA